VTCEYCKRQAGLEQLYRLRDPCCGQFDREADLDWSNYDSHHHLSDVSLRADVLNLFLCPL
jgi:hypothetical protein